MRCLDEKRINKVNQELNTSLIDVNDSVLVVIDVQEHFLDKLEKEESELLVKRICWLVSVAKRLNVPIVVTVENKEQYGNVAPEIEELLPPSTKILDKKSFGLAGDLDIVKEIADKNRNTTILCGLETDVCVAQSAIGLLECGYKVAVIENASASPDEGHEYGIDRISGAGVLLTNVKSLYYEWIRTGKRDDDFMTKYASELPDIEIVF